MFHPRVSESEIRTGRLNRRPGRNYTPELTVTLPGFRVAVTPGGSTGPETRAGSRLTQGLMTPGSGRSNRGLDSVGTTRIRSLTGVVV